MLSVKPRPTNRQPALIDARPFRTARERLAFIRARIDQVREERRLRQLGRRRRAAIPPPSSSGFLWTTGPEA